MSGLRGPDLWRGALRTVRWSPIVTAPLAASLALVGLRLIAGPVAVGRLRIVEDVGLALTAVTVAFLADDVTTDASPAVPIEAPARLRLRLAVGAPTAALGWLAVSVIAHQVMPDSDFDDAPGKALAGVGLAATALAMAAVARRIGAPASPGAVGMACLVAAGFAWLAAPTAWAEALPPPDAAWPMLIALALLTIAVAGREPASV